MSRDALQTGAGTSNDDAPEPLSRIAGEPVRSTDPVRAYLREIGRAALLSAAEEVDLAKRIEVGLYAAERLRTAADPTDEACGCPKIGLRPLTCCAAAGGSPA